MVCWLAFLPAVLLFVLFSTLFSCLSSQQQRALRADVSNHSRPRALYCHWQHAFRWNHRHGDGLTRTLEGKTLLPRGGSPRVSVVISPLVCCHGFNNRVPPPPPPAPWQIFLLIGFLVQIVAMLSLHVVKKRGVIF